jgi:ParB family transcriptional regulator, chromosome partitioning protein
MNTNINIITIPLNKPTAWKGNVRKTDAGAAIDELAASIASHGLLQSLVVKADRKSGKRGTYAAIAGRRRFLALKALAKAGRVEANMPVPCRVASGEIDPAELSLAENIMRMPMHPADQFEAFRDLIENGASVPDIAARFAIAESVVSKRLKLGVPLYHL